MTINFFFSLNFDTFLRNLTPGEFELASPIACSSRVDYCDFPLWRACSQAKVSKNARTLESLSFGSGGSRPSDRRRGDGGGHPDPDLTGGGGGGGGGHGFEKIFFGPSGLRLRVVPLFFSGIVERAKREPG